ncbi:hypothetical protein [Streptomyces diastatochromogenes]|uniref:Uncharacterized protein n=1 Tax=Streptomyces diastatochromogenes TaxID=42236 RepID=A0A233SBR0_STRDA|nr:hypothetical protein [Streptomyces diastatochromogenes]MCZ0988103.1 hypothetical protein [Streptomyces diastatochromogenes]OXY93081.1 hypothetical protein BEK98_22890 [Streptomyces diastatochromogenes]
MASDEEPSGSASRALRSRSLGAELRTDLDHGRPARVIVPANPRVNNTEWVHRGDESRPASGHGAAL